MKAPILDSSPRKVIESNGDEACLLKLLREKKKLSRTKLSKLSQLSTYQVEGLEGKGTQNLLDKLFLYIHALDYKVEDVMNLMEPQVEDKFLRGSFLIPVSETNFKEGIKFSTYLSQSDKHILQLQLGPSQSLKREFFHECDMVMGIVREGTLVIDISVKQMVYKKEQFFIFPGSLKFNFLNGDVHTHVSTLLFFLKYPR